jgi:transposase
MAPTRPPSSSALAVSGRGAGVTPAGGWSKRRAPGDRIALEGLQQIAPLFAVERASRLAGETADARRLRRQADTRPVLEELRKWLDHHRDLTPPKTPLGQALGYLHRQWKRLLLFLDDGNIEATNNRRERELRRLIIGRKNWLFTWLDIGGERTAAILSIIATCIAHEVNPRAYLHLVTRLIVEGWSHAKLRDLLPDRIVVAHPELHVRAHAVPPPARS